MGATDKTSLLNRLLAGDTASLARAISILENGDEAADALAGRLHQHTGRAQIISFTGPPGAGKSMLINAYVAWLRDRNQPVAVIAVDPSSPLSGGAVLGDRARMGEHTLDDGVFIRSVASRGRVGGLSQTIPEILDLVDAAGWPIIILETVGAGQTDTEFAAIADIKIVLNAPGLGDDLQAIKAGILEVADILLVNKSDQPDAKKTFEYLRSMLKLRRGGAAKTPLIATSATTGDGVETLGETINAMLARNTGAGANASRVCRLETTLFAHCQAAFAADLKSAPSDLVITLCTEIRSGSCSIDMATERLMRHISTKRSKP